MISSSTKSWKYDGKTYKDEVYTVTYDGADATADSTGKVFTLSTGDTVTITATAAGVKDYDAEYSKNNTYTYVLKNADYYSNVTANVGTLSIEKREVTLTSASDSKRYDSTPLTNDEVTETGDGFVSGEGATYNVTGSQTLVGSSANAFTYTLKAGTNADNYNIAKAEGKLTVTDDGGPGGGDPVAPDLVVTKYAEDKQYQLDDVVTFSITATNIYQDAQTITLDEIEGVTLEKKEFADVEPGGTIETTASYTITNADIVNGSFTNTVTAHVGNTTKTADATVNTVKYEPHLTVTKTTTSRPANGEKYGLGETITYKINVINDGNVTITDITVTDELTGDTWNVGTLDPGQTSQDLTAVHKVTDADIVAGQVVNVATASGTSPDPNDPDVPVTPGEDPEPTVKYEPHLTVTKTTTSRPANGEKYGLGEKISYEITVTNDGSVNITGITVTDALTGDAWTVAGMAPGTSVVFGSKEYTVTEADVIAGKVLNVATAKGTSPDPNDPDVPVTPGEKEDPTVDPNGHLTVTKDTTSTPANGQTYAFGEKITYKITVLNDGNLTITNIKVEDELTGDEWTLDSLAPGLSAEFEAEYTVADKDIIAGKVLNVATATGTSPDPDEPIVPVTPGEKEDPTEDPDGHLTITKVTTSTPANGETYALGETIEYEITVLNDGNLTITDITVTDELTGDEWTIASLAPEASETFTASYTVAEEDILAGEVVNEATATGTSPDPDEPEVPVVPGVDPEPTEDKRSHMTVNKVTTSKPADGVAYMPGEMISYRITVINDGNLTITDITVTDELTGDKWTVASLAPGASESFTTTYTVTAADVLAGSVVNVATATGTSTDPNNPNVPVEPGVDPEPTEPDTYQLTISYRYSDGTVAAADYILNVKYGEPYSVISPVIGGYTANLETVTGIMPKRPVEVTVIYYENPGPSDDAEPEAGDEIPVIPFVPFLISDYETPLGLGSLSLNVGETIE